MSTANAPITDRDHVVGVPLPVISDEAMRERAGQAREYTAVLLRKTAMFVRPQVDPIIREHGRRNIALTEPGVLAMALPANNHPELAGVGIFAADPDQVRDIMDHDPGVQVGIFVYELLPVRGFPGSELPG